MSFLSHNLRLEGEARIHSYALLARHFSATHDQLKNRTWRMQSFLPPSPPHHFSPFHHLLPVFPASFPYYLLSPSISLVRLSFRIDISSHIYTMDGWVEWMAGWLVGFCLFSFFAPLFLHQVTLVCEWEPGKLGGSSAI
ncbi:hypothetical protein IWX49DRAFT_352021 [Phyllosticta citricarpa]